jgi:hypothetical protein
VSSKTNVNWLGNTEDAIEADLAFKASTASGMDVFVGGGKNVQRLTGPKVEVFSKTLTSILWTKSKLYIGRNDGTISVIWDTLPSSGATTFSVGQSSLTSLSLVGNTIFCAAGTNIHDLNVATNISTKAWAMGQTVTELHANPILKTLWAALADGTVAQISTDTSTIVCVYKDGPTAATAMTTNDNSLYVAGADGKVYAWSICAVAIRKPGVDSNDNAGSGSKSNGGDSRSGEAAAEDSHGGLIAGIVGR